MNVTKQVRKDFWVRIAWSFVRPNAADGGHVRLDRRLRLQLYKYRAFWFWEKAPDRDSSVCPAYWQVCMHTYIYVYIRICVGRRPQTTVRCALPYIYTCVLPYINAYVCEAYAFAGFAGLFP